MIGDQDTPPLYPPVPALSSQAAHGPALRSTAFSLTRFFLARFGESVPCVLGTRAIGDVVGCAAATTPMLTIAGPCCMLCVSDGGNMATRARGPAMLATRIERAGTHLRITPIIPARASVCLVLIDNRNTRIVPSPRVCGEATTCNIGATSQHTQRDG